MSQTRTSPQAPKKRAPWLRRCTWCANQRLKPAPAHGLQTLLPLVLCRVYSCEHCKQRFVRPLGG